MLIHNTNHENENCFWGLTRAMQFESISMYRSVARCTRVTLRKTCLPGSRILALAMPGGCARRSAGDCRLAVFKGNLGLLHWPLIYFHMEQPKEQPINMQGFLYYSIKSLWLQRISFLPLTSE